MSQRIFNAAVKELLQDIPQVLQDAGFRFDPTKEPKHDFQRVSKKIAVLREKIDKLSTP